jgi:hypothetical protein
VLQKRSQNQIAQRVHDMTATMQVLRRPTSRLITLLGGAALAIDAALMPATPSLAETLRWARAGMR